MMNKPIPAIAKKLPVLMRYKDVEDLQQWDSSDDNIKEDPNKLERLFALTKEFEIGDEVVSIESDLSTRTTIDNETE